MIATDVSLGMLDVARKNFPDIHFQQADMLDLNLGKTFDVIVCLFSSIGYVKSYKNLNKTIKNFVQHLKKGGVIIIEPWLSESSYTTGTPGMTIYDGDDIKIARLSISKKKGIVSIMDMHYLIAERDKHTKHFVERHELAMFDSTKVISMMNHHGLKARFLKNGLTKERGLYIGIKK